MPWAESCAMDERVCFVAAHVRHEEPMQALCDRYGISRKTGYKWLRRYQALGAAGLEARSSAPLLVCYGVSPETAGLIVALRQARPSWGPRKLLARLMMDHPECGFPAASTIGELLRREGLSAPRRRRRRADAVAAALVEPCTANDSWSADFKGWFRTGDGVRCEPLTLADGFSRYVLLTEAVARVSYDCVQPLFVRAFRRHGLPRAVRSDNGSPFANRRGLAGLTRLSVWLLKLGIWPDRIAPGRPDQNGRHERMHRTLAEDATRPPAATLAEQQRRLDAWREDFNRFRPHEGLGQRCPAALYTPSPRPYPERLAGWEYPPDHHVRRVSSDGYVVWRDARLYLTEALRGETVGFGRQDDGDWAIRFRDYTLAVLDDADGKIKRDGLARPLAAVRPPVAGQGHHATQSVT